MPVVRAKQMLVLNGVVLFSGVASQVNRMFDVVYSALLSVGLKDSDFVLNIVVDRKIDYKI